jgi:Glyoxalase-like domain
LNIQITIDCADPNALAAFYAAAGIGYELEDTSEAIRQLVDAGILRGKDVIERDHRLCFSDAATCISPEAALPRMHFQRVQEPKATKNRIHLDFQLRGDNAGRDALVDHLLELGGRRIGERTQGPVHAWVIMADPEGNEFCVSN